MPFNPDIHHRKSHRMQRYDYRRPGAHFITVCTHNRESVFGGIMDGTMHLNAAGRIVQSVWDGISSNLPNVSLDAYVVMPDHFHSLVVITDSVGAIHESPGCFVRQSPGCSVRQSPGCSVRQSPGYFVPPHRAIRESPLQMTFAARRNMIIPKLIGRFKMQTAKQINTLRNTPGNPLWQRDYWERIVRNESELQAIRPYIHNNPRKWQ